MNKCVLNHYFNSIKVQFEPKFGKNDPSQSSFQFHKGTI